MQYALLSMDHKLTGLSVATGQLANRTILVIAANRRELLQVQLPQDCIGTKIIGGMLYTVDVPGTRYLLEIANQDRIRGIRPDMILITEKVAASNSEEYNRVMTYTRFISEAYHIEWHIIPTVGAAWEYR